MSIYYFDIGRDGQLKHDFIGTELSSLRQAFIYAQQAMAEGLMLDNGGLGNYKAEIRIRDSRGSIVFTGSLQYVGERVPVGSP